MILTHLVLFSFLNGAGGDVTPPTPTPTPTPFGGKRGKDGKRRYFTYDDGRTVDIRDDYHLSQIVTELMQARQSEAEQAKIERRAKGKVSRKVKRAAPRQVPQIDPQIIYDMIQALADQALTQSTILTMLDAYQRSMAEDEDLTLILLSL